MPFGWKLVREGLEPITVNPLTSLQQEHQSLMDMLKDFNRRVEAAREGHRAMIQTLTVEMDGMNQIHSKLKQMQGSSPE